MWTGLPVGFCLSIPGLGISYIPKSQIHIKFPIPIAGSRMTSRKEPKNQWQNSRTIFKWRQIWLRKSMGIFNFSLVELSWPKSNGSSSAPSFFMANLLCIHPILKPKSPRCFSHMITFISHEHVTNLQFIFSSKIFHQHLAGDRLGHGPVLCTFFGDVILVLCL